MSKLKAPVAAAQFGFPACAFASLVERFSSHGYVDGPVGGVVDSFLVGGVTAPDLLGNDVLEDFRVVIATWLTDGALEQRGGQPVDPRRCPEDDARRQQHASCAELDWIETADDAGSQQTVPRHLLDASQCIGRASRYAQYVEVVDLEVVCQGEHVVRPVEDATIDLEGRLAAARTVGRDNTDVV